MSDILSHPCIFCGYSGRDYWQAGSHASACPWHEIGGEEKRAHFLRHELTRLTARVAELEAEIRQIVEAVEPPLNENGVWCGSTVEAVRATTERAESAERERDELRRENERLREALDNAVAVQLKLAAKECGNG
jgi:chromosome segregation ATPase